MVLCVLSLYETTSESMKLPKYSNDFPKPNQNGIRIGIDIGGTFTDFVALDASMQVIQTLKVPSTPDEPELAVFTGLNILLSDHLSANKENLIDIIHGSTVATNALLERKGSKTAFITTEGFRDILKIGRQNRAELYNLAIQEHEPIINDELRFEVKERVNSQGEIQTPLEYDLENLCAIIRRENVKSIGISLLFSFLEPKHEIEIKQALQSLDIHISISSEVLPEFREFERSSTTAVNAYVSPILEAYLTKLDHGLPTARIRVMQSNGGSISIPTAAQNGARCILSGPAGGVTAVKFLRDNYLRDASENPPRGLIAFDMGGTSTDVSLISDEINITRESIIGDLPIAVPMMQITTIGAGGGSIASLDSGGALRVGPQSAGADPGPACYGKGNNPTVTDANLVLGRLSPDHFLQGKMPLFPDFSFKAVENLAKLVGTSVEECALGIIEVANAHMAKAIRVISVERGYDPSDYPLLSFGGAGGLHAVDLARNVGINQVIIPPTASVLSAFGMLVSDTIKDYSKTIMKSKEIDYYDLSKEFLPLREQAQKDMKLEGYSDDDIYFEEFLDMRYHGQSYELLIPFQPNYTKQFHETHNRNYGYKIDTRPVEIVTIRVRGIGRNATTKFPKFDQNYERVLSESRIEHSQVILRSTSIDKAKKAEYEKVPCLKAEHLPFLHTLSGPMLILCENTTIFVSRKDRITKDTYGNIVIDIVK